MNSQSITGYEICNESRSPYFALVCFYKAFNDSCLLKTRENWLIESEITMSNPLGGVKMGWKNISGVYEKIYAGPAKVYVEFYDYTINETAEMFVASGREAGRLEIGGTVIELDIRTSRIYRLHQQQWKQVHHHGSMDNPKLLDAYQRLING